MKISVIVPVYNAEAYLETCLDALLAQTYEEFELILADDGSSDRSGAICDRYAKQDGRIQVLHQEHEGQNSARAAGLFLARGEYAAFADADDWTEPLYLEHLVQALENSDADIVCSGCVCEENGEAQKQLNHIAPGIYSGEDGRERLYSEMLYSGDGFFDFGILPYLWNKLYRTALLRECYSDIDRGIYDGEDVMVVYPYLLRAKTIAVTEDCDCHYRIRQDSVSHSKKEDFYENVSRLYLYLNREFRRSPYFELLRPQLDQYMRMMVWSGAKEEYIKLQRYYFPFCRVPCGSSVVLYGGGLLGQAYYRQIQETGYCRLAAWVDPDHQKLRLEGYPVDPPEILKTVDYDHIVIAQEKKQAAEKIRLSLLSLGIKEECVIGNEE